MSGEIYQIETRRRSRSKTPSQRNDYDKSGRAGEEGDHIKKPSVAPSVHTIMEEHVVETTTTISSGSSSTTAVATSTSFPKGARNITTRSKALAQLTSDYSSDDATPEAKRKASTVTTMFTSTTNRLGKALNSLTAVTSTPRSQLETTQNVLNTSQELHQQQQQQQQRTNGNFNAKANLSDDHLAYIEYRDAGEYWNKTPKTDYTYSELSPHRRQLAPGIVAMPNMSRRSLEHHEERVNNMVDLDPTKEEFIRRRYQGNYTHLNYDSADEADNTYFGQQKQQSWWLLRIITTIISSISSMWTSISNISQTESNAYQMYYAKHERQPKHGLIATSLLSVMRYVYLGIASVLSLDTTLLKSNNTENKSKKRFLLFLLILLPLLLLAGLFYYLHPNESFPPKSLNLNTFTLPELPKIDVGAYLNAAQYEALRTQAIDQAVRVRDWADDYLVYLKTIGQNVANRGRQWFQSNGDDVYYERI